MKISLIAYHFPQPQDSAVQPRANQPRANQPCVNQPVSQHCADPFCAGQAAHVRGLGRALAAAGHQVVIYARKDHAGLPDTVPVSDGLAIRYLAAGPAAPASAGELPAHLGSFGSRLAACLRQAKPDVVHACHWASGLAALAATRQYQVPVVQTFGSLGVAERRAGRSDPQQAARLRMEACLARAVAGVLAVSAEEADDLAALGVPGSRVQVVPTGVDLEAFSQYGQASPATPPPGRPRLLLAGSLGPDERVDVIIRALVQLPDAELVIAGGEAAGPPCRALGKLAAGLDVLDRVTFAGQVTDEELPALLRSADLLVSAARHEPLGTTAIQAMACGTPVAATAVGACRDAVVDGTTGVLVPPDRPQAIGQRVRELAATPMRLAAFGVASADRARCRYPWQRIAGETVAAYERVAAVPAASAA